MISFLKLIRYKNLLMVLLTMVLTKYALLNTSINIKLLSGLHFIILSISILSITAAGYVINDIFDVKTDTINKPQKLIIRTKISIKKGEFIYQILNVIGVICGLYISFTLEKINVAFVFFLSILGLYYYSKKLKQVALIGNLLIAFLVSLTIIIVFLFDTYSFHKKDSIIQVLHNFFYSSSVSLKVFGYALFAFVITFLREIIKDIEDMNGDYAANMKTLPILIGSKRTNTFVLVLSSLFFIILLYTIKELIHYKVLFYYGVIFIVIPFAYFLFKLKFANSKIHYHYLSQLLKIIMFFGILSMLLFKFI